ncbi:UNVERIFIED_CONTAM: hypothetical protein RMT77_015438 [Armadillidium vulgare]
MSNKIQNSNISQPKKRKRKNKENKKTVLVNEESDDKVNNNAPPPVRNSDEPLPKKVKWTNKQRVLVFASRKIGLLGRHLMNDIRTILPHSKPDVKKEGKGNLEINNEIAEMKNCNKCIFFEAKKYCDLYMWISNIKNGPSIKFLVENAHTMTELKLTGNSLQGSRPLICFDENFKEPHLLLMKELLTQIFSTPKGHPKSQPFFDHVLVFSYLDDKIWFRNYQIVEEDGQLTEIGPRFVLNPIRIFEGSFKGETLWSNPKYVPPNKLRIDKKKMEAGKYVNTINQKHLRNIRIKDQNFVGDPTSEFFESEPPEPKKKSKKMSKRNKK